MKFKVGDRVQVVATYSGFYGDKGNVTENDGTDNLPVRVRFDDGEHVCWFYEDDLKVLHEEEKVMKFKVGDKVKVSDSWRGNSGKVGTISRADWGVMYKYRVEFEYADPESFKEEELELVKEKDNYPTLKQAYKSLLEIQKELTTLEESMMCTVRHTRTEIARNEEELAELESKILEAAKQ